jgi:hypothetical protein
MSMFWKNDWPRAQKHLINWWRHSGPAFSITAPKDEPWQDIPRPPASPVFSQPGFDKFPRILQGFPENESAPDLQFQWTDPAYRFNASAYWLSRMYFGGEAFPYFDSQMGPGNLAAFLGSDVGFGQETVWFESCMESLATAPPLVFDPNNHWWQVQTALVDYALQHADGRFLVGMPDFSVTLDVLASLAGTTEVLMALALQPEAVMQRSQEIAAAYMLAFDTLYDRIKDSRNGNCYSCFNVWGPGKTTLLQCDLSAMFGPDMFADIAVPGLSAMAGQFDYTLYHLDGSQALCHLDALLAIPGIDAIEWTPEPGRPWGGDPEWYELYRTIKNAGKSVQAIFVKPDQAVPLIEAVGPEGIFLDIRCSSETEARQLEDRLQKWY